MDKLLSSRPSYRLFVTFLPERQRLSPAKNFNSPSVCKENKSLPLSALPTETQVNFLSDNSLRPCEWGSQFDWGAPGKHLTSHRHHHHDMYRHASLGAAASAFWLNSWRFTFKAEMLRSVWITIGGELANHRSGIYASSPVWMGLLTYVDGLTAVISCFLVLKLPGSGSHNSAGHQHLHPSHAIASTSIFTCPLSGPAVITHNSSHKIRLSVKVKVSEDRMGQKEWNSKVPL